MTYRPKKAWLIAAAYFCVCIAIARTSDVLAQVLFAPLATAAQAADPLWWTFTAAYVALIFAAYGWVWPLGTFTDGRKRHLLLAAFYGFSWGICQGLLFVSIWMAVARSGLGVWWVAGISYLLIGGYNACYHRFFWDIHVSPPHNYTEWNARKVLLCHTPNLLMGLLYLALFGNFGIFVLMQALALALSAHAMRFPAPWDDYSAEAGRERSLKEMRA